MFNTFKNRLDARRASLYHRNKYVVCFHSQWSESWGLSDSIPTDDYTAVYHRGMKVA